LVRIQFRDRPVEPVRDGVEIVRKQTGVEVEGHGLRCVTEHLLNSLEVGAGRHGETGCGVPQLVRVSRGSPAFSAVGSKNRGRKLVFRSTTAFGGGKHEIAGRLRCQVRCQLVGEKARDRH
jgi:hypothetical protein